jgi:gliding motility-associated-like protein
MKTLISVLCLFLCGQVTAQSFSADLVGNPVNTTGWTYASGTSFVSGDEFVLTRPQTNQAGYIYYSTPQDLTVCARFSVSFEFRITEHSTPTADGIAFWYITNPPTGFSLGGGIGLPSNPDGLLLILDTYNNDGVSDNPLVSLRLLDGTNNYLEGSADGRLAADRTNQSFIIDNNWHTCLLTYDYGSIEVSFDGGAPVMTGFAPLNMTGYFGFSAGTGSAWSRQVIRNVHISGAPEPDPPVVSDRVYCQFEPADTLVAIGTHIRWYESITGGSPLPGAPTPNTSIPGIYTWYVTQEIPGCPFESARTPVTVTVYEAVNAGFSDTLHYGCTEDTLMISYAGPAVGNYEWDFGDGQTATGRMPRHAYNTPGTYQVKLKVVNGTCEDSAETTVTIMPFMQTGFTVDRDSICQGEAVQFTNQSTGTDLHYFWDFDDGTTDTIPDPVHTYERAGIYEVMFAVSDFRGCTDTLFQTIVVDSTSPFSLTASDTIVCAGAVIHFSTDYRPTGNSSLEWDLGDGTVAADSIALRHPYETPGVFPVVVTGHYRSCPDSSHQVNITVHPWPVVNLGPDTALCPGDAPLLLYNLAPQPAEYTSRWSTGDTLVNEIAVGEPGKYWLRVTSANGCNTTDSIDIFPSCNIGIPNIFSPNGDGINDYFFPREILSRGVTNFRMQVFNRWGLLVFETRSVNGRGWDGRFNGKDQPQDVYVYMIEAGFANGVAEKYQGNVTLIR